MLTRVEIKNYRGFESYRMQDLCQVNLLVGKNNSGKTALLEGVQFLTSGGDPAVLAEAAERRGEVLLTRSDPTAFVDVAHFFHGHALSADCSFTISGDNGYHPVSLRTFVADNRDKSRTPPAPGSERADVSGFFLKVSGPTRSDREELQFRISREGGVDFELPSPRFRRPGNLRKYQKPQVCFVGPDSLDSTNLAVMWDEVTLRGQELGVAEAMRTLEPELESVHFLTGMIAQGYLSSRSGIVVGMKGQETRVPLGSMGDGMRRLMALATSLAFTKEGCLFVDEIDTGLHYSVMSDMWKMVIAKAVASNTQVFATTHSWDCIEGIALLCQKEPEFMPRVAIHKIDRAIPHSIPFSGESIVRMAKADIDPR